MQHKKKAAASEGFIANDSKRNACILLILADSYVSVIWMCSFFFCLCRSLGWVWERDICKWEIGWVGVGGNRVHRAKRCTRWCVYGGFLVQVHRIFSYFNSSEGMPFIFCFLNSFSCYGMRASYYIIIYISALKTWHQEHCWSSNNSSSSTIIIIIDGGTEISHKHAHVRVHAGCVCVCECEYECNDRAK